MSKKDKLFKREIVVFLNGKKMPGSRFFVNFKAILKEDGKSVCVVCGDEFPDRNRFKIKEIINAANELVPSGSDIRKKVAAKFRRLYKSRYCPECAQAVVDNSRRG